MIRWPVARCDDLPEMEAVWSAESLHAVNDVGREPGQVYGLVPERGPLEEAHMMPVRNVTEPDGHRVEGGLFTSARLTDTSSLWEALIRCEGADGADRRAVARPSRDQPCVAAQSLSGLRGDGVTGLTGLTVETGVIGVTVDCGVRGLNVGCALTGVRGVRGVTWVRGSAGEANRELFGLAV